MKELARVAGPTPSLWSISGASVPITPEPPWPLYPPPFCPVPHGLHGTFLLSPDLKTIVAMPNGVRHTLPRSSERKRKVVRDGQDGDVAERLKAAVC